MPPPLQSGWQYSAPTRPHLLGQYSAMLAPENADNSARDIARALIFEDTVAWSDVLGPFVFARTVLDLEPPAPQPSGARQPRLRRSRKAPFREYTGGRHCTPRQ